MEANDLDFETSLRILPVFYAENCDTMRAKLRTILTYSSFEYPIIILIINDQFKISI